MSRHILIVEPDISGRSMMDRVLTSEGYAVDAVDGAVAAKPILDVDDVDLVIVDEVGGRRDVLSDVRWLRRSYPRVPVVVIGALMSQRILQELVRLGVADALSKPFTPAELRTSVARAAGRVGPSRDEALDYDAAISAARAAIAAGRPDDAKPALRRAQGVAPFDAEAMALWALVAELEGRDDAADRGYRAALALRTEEDTPAPDPHEGLARLFAYRTARPVAALGAAWAKAPAWLVGEPVVELRSGPPAASPVPRIAVVPLGIAPDGPGAFYFRQDGDRAAFVLFAGSLSRETLEKILSRLGADAPVASVVTSERLDLPRVTELRRAAGQRS